MRKSYTFRPVWISLTLLVIASVLFLTINANGQWNFILPLRAGKLASLILVAYAIGVSTLLFQTITNNPILTPSILGFDSLYVFLQTLMVALIGGLGYTQLSPSLKFVIALIAMVAGSLLLFQMLLRQGGGDLTRMILIGVIFGIFFRSLTGLMQRLIDPEEFAIVQANSFATFNTVNHDLLKISAVIIGLSTIAIWRQRFKLDVYLLGRDQAINLGIRYPTNTLWILTWIALLVATSTALVGPVSFFGLLVCALANHFARTVHHSLRIPLVSTIAALVLVAGQLVFEHLLNMQAVLSVVVEFAGGLVFLYLVLRKKAS
ncbi:MAG: iron chelate uptake ABC transporter family permease subunit [Neisseria sp.]|uniref:iron chelate uptake ABC transporter family permease subunit n=1 Tax=Neisseria sp. TaxID=192066 RepID=UPI0026DAB0DC|nr:iron chelate uptake ABC transporter family permease subunit [Neisseria sp.]MDO4642093.1 iron chelate uptake ABC transporter family permease subunit [Neisseria sp.]